MEKKRILFVDDDPNVLMGLKRAFRKESYDVLVATSGEEALTVLKNNHVDVVVADQNMPSMTGTEFLSVVVKLYPDTIRFMLTGNATLEVAIQAINHGAISRFFTKPCNEIDLVTTIRQALQKKDLMAEAWRLYKKTREQSAILENLERKYPGLTRVERDDHGAVIINGNPPQDFDEFMKELRRTVSDKECALREE